MVADHGGDTLIPNIPVGTHFDSSNNAYKIIRRFWMSAEFGSTIIPNLFKTYDGAYKGGLSLLTNRQFERIEVFDHFIAAGQDLNAMDGFVPLGGGREPGGAGGGDSQDEARGRFT